MVPLSLPGLKDENLSIWSGRSAWSLDATLRGDRLMLTWATLHSYLDAILKSTLNILIFIWSAMVKTESSLTDSFKERGPLPFSCQKCKLHNFTRNWTFFQPSLLLRCVFRFPSTNIRLMFQSLVDESGPPPNLGNAFSAAPNAAASAGSTTLGSFVLNKLYTHIYIYVQIHSI